MLGEALFAPAAVPIAPAAGPGWVEEPSRACNSGPASLPGQVSRSA